MRITAQFIDAFPSFIDLVNTPMRIFIEREILLLDYFRMVAFDPMRHGLRCVFARFREVVPKMQHHRQPHRAVANAQRLRQRFKRHPRPRCRACLRAHFRFPPLRLLLARPL